MHNPEQSTGFGHCSMPAGTTKQLNTCCQQKWAPRHEVHIAEFSAPTWTQRLNAGQVHRFTLRSRSAGTPSSSSAQVGTAACRQAAKAPLSTTAALDAAALSAAHFARGCRAEHLTRWAAAPTCLQLQDAPTATCQVGGSNQRAGVDTEAPHAMQAAHLEPPGTQGGRNVGRTVDQKAGGGPQLGDRCPSHAGTKCERH